VLQQRAAHAEVIIGFEIGAQLVAISFNSPVSGKHVHLNMLSLQEPVPQGTTRRLQTLYVELVG
jgi:hypothetical protein